MFIHGARGQTAGLLQSPPRRRAPEHHGITLPGWNCWSSPACTMTGGTKSGRTWTRLPATAMLAVFKGHTPFKEGSSLFLTTEPLPPTRTRSS